MMRNYGTQYNYEPEPPTEVKSGNYDDPTLIYEKKQRFANQKLSKMDEKKSRNFKKVYLAKNEGLVVGCFMGMEKNL